MKKLPTCSFIFFFVAILFSSTSVFSQSLAEFSIEMPGVTQTGSNNGTVSIPITISNGGSPSTVSYIVTVTHSDGSITVSQGQNQTVQSNAENYESSNFTFNRE